MLESGRNVMNGEELKMIKNNSRIKFYKEDKYHLMEDKANCIEALENKNNVRKETRNSDYIDDHQVREKQEVSLLLDQEEELANCFQDIPEAKVTKKYNKKRSRI